jgi:uncharacterized membrane protein YkvA (DUF1232 family)
MSSRSPFRLGMGVLGLWPFVPLASRAPIYGRLLLALLSDARVPVRSKAVLGAAAAYIASPIDLIPDFIPFISRVDDAAVLVLAVDYFLETVPRELVVEKMHDLGIDGRELERDLESARRAIPRPVRMAMRRLPKVAGRASFIARREVAKRTGRPEPKRASQARRRSERKPMEEAPE